MDNLDLDLFCMYFSPKVFNGLGDVQATSALPLKPWYVHLLCARQHCRAG